MVPDQKCLLYGLNHSWYPTMDTKSAAEQQTATPKLSLPPSRGEPHRTAVGTAVLGKQHLRLGSLCLRIHKSWIFLSFLPPPAPDKARGRRLSDHEQLVFTHTSATATATPFLLRAGLGRAELGRSHALLGPAQLMTSVLQKCLSDAAPTSSYQVDFMMVPMKHQSLSKTSTKKCHLFDEHLVTVLQELSPFQVD